MKPQRIQLKRTKGWRKPENTVVVSRPSKYGNPFHTGMALTEADVYCRYFNSAWAKPLIGSPLTAEDAVFLYRKHITDDQFDEPLISQWRDELRGKNLACWCNLGEVCHGDVLIELANSA